MYKVMIVDDEVSVRGMLERNLKASSLDIEVAGCAGDGQEALEMAKKIKPDIVITDISMPFMNGLELISALQEEGIASKNIIISGYDEFDYARTAIALGVTDYLLKPFMPDELWEVLEKIIRELDNQNILSKNLQMLKEQADRHIIQDRELALRKIINGEKLGDREKEALSFPKSSAGKFMEACLLNLKGTVWNFSMQEQVEEFMELMEYGYFPGDIAFRGISIEKNKLAIFFFGTASSARDLRNQVVDGLKKITRSLMQYYDITAYCALGRVCATVDELSESYQEAVETWKEALNPEKTIRIYGEEKATRPVDDSQVSERIRNMKSCIRGAVSIGNAEESLNLLGQLMKLYASMSGKGTEYVVVSIGELVYGIGDDMEKNGFGRVDQEASRQLKGKMASGSLLEIEELMEEYLRLCCDKIQQNMRQNRAEAAVSLVQNWVEDNLKDHTISVETAAETVHFSVSYLRQIFKEITGESFNEFLIRKRMEKAGEYLQNTSMKIQDIAERCGYENQRYFASSFKKFYGCTPTDFKELVSKKQL